MRKFNLFVGIALAILSVLTILANYFNVIPVIITGTTVALSALCGLIAMLQVYYWVEYLEDYNPGRFWSIYSAIGGVICIVVLNAMGFHLVTEKFGASALYGLTGTLFPIIGLFIGDIGRVLFRSEKPVVF